MHWQESKCSKLSKQLIIIIITRIYTPSDFNFKAVLPLISVMNTTPSIVGNVIIIVCLDVIFLVIFKYFVSNRFNSLSSHRGKPENPGKNCRQLCLKWTQNTFFCVTWNWTWDCKHWCMRFDYAFSPLRHSDPKFNEGIEIRKVDEI